MLESKQIYCKCCTSIIFTTYVRYCVIEMDKENEKQKQKENKSDNRKIQREWSIPGTKRLIELYEARQDLWNPLQPNYQNR